MNETNEIVTEINRIYGQVGVQFAVNFVSDTVTDPKEWSVPDLDSSSDKVTGIYTHVPNQINVYFVQTLYEQELVKPVSWNPLTWHYVTNAIHGYTVLHHDYGCLVAADLVGPVGGHDDISDIARCTAHELGHYLLNTTDHDGSLWNLMRDNNASSYNSNLRLKQADSFFAVSAVGY